MRPDHSGRTHPDPRDDPPTQAFDPANARTECLHEVAVDTVAIPTVAPAEAPVPAVPPPAPAAVEGKRDGVALALSSLLGSLAGFVSWLIAARIMSTTEVGNAQLVVSAFILVGGAAQLNIGIGLMRWLPGAGRHTGRLAWRALLVVLPLAALVGLVYGILTPRLADISAGAGGSPALGLLVFVLACAGWCVFSLHDFLLVAAGKPWWTVWRNGLFAVARIALLVVLGGVAGLGAYGVVLSWVGPIVVWVVLGCVVVAVLARRISARAEGGSLPGRAEAIAFLGPTAVSQIGASLLYNQVPVVVNVRFGPDTGAVFFIAWQAVMVIDLAAAFFMNSLAVAVAREPHRRAELAAAARRRLLVLFLPALAVGAALATPLLSIFGAAYAEADDVLRLLLLGLAFRLVVAHELGVRQAIGWALGFARLQLLSTVLVLVVAIVMPVAGGGVAALLPVAIGYIAVQVVCVAAVLAFPAQRRADVEVRSP